MAKRTFRAEATFVLLTLVITSWSIFALYKLTIPIDFTSPRPAIQTTATTVPNPFKTNLNPNAQSSGSILNNPLFSKTSNINKDHNNTSNNNDNNSKSSTKQTIAPPQAANKSIVANSTLAGGESLARNNRIVASTKRSNNNNLASDNVQIRDKLALSNQSDHDEINLQQHGKLSNHLNAMRKKGLNADDINTVKPNNNGPHLWNRYAKIPDNSKHEAHPHATSSSNLIVLDTPTQRVELARDGHDANLQQRDRIASESNRNLAQLSVAMAEPTMTTTTTESPLQSASHFDYNDEFATTTTGMPVQSMIGDEYESARALVLNKEEKQDENDDNNSNNNNNDNNDNNDIFNSNSDDYSNGFNATNIQTTTSSSPINQEEEGEHQQQMTSDERHDADQGQPSEVDEAAAREASRDVDQELDRIAQPSGQLERNKSSVIDDNHQGKIINNVVDDDIENDNDDDNVNGGHYHRHDDELHSENNRPPISLAKLLGGHKMSKKGFNNKPFDSLKTAESNQRKPNVQNLFIENGHSDLSRFTIRKANDIDKVLDRLNFDKLIDGGQLPMNNLHLRTSRFKRETYRDDNNNKSDIAPTSNNINGVDKLTSLSTKQAANLAFWPQNYANYDPQSAMLSLIALENNKQFDGSTDRASPFYSYNTTPVVQPTAQQLAEWLSPLERKRLLHELSKSKLPAPTEKLHKTSRLNMAASLGPGDDVKLSDTQASVDHQPASSLFTVDHGLLLYPSEGNDHHEGVVSKKKKKYKKSKHKHKLSIGYKKGGHKKKKHKKEEKKYIKEKKFKGAKKGKKIKKGKGGQGGKKGKKKFKDKGYKKKGFKNVYHKEEFGQKKSYFDEFRDKDFKKKWKKYDDNYKYAQMKKWQAKDIKGAKKMKDHGEKFKKYDKSRFKKKYEKEMKEHKASASKKKSKSW